MNADLKPPTVLFVWVAEHALPFNNLSLPFTALSPILIGSVALKSLQYPFSGHFPSSSLTKNVDSTKQYGKK